MFVPETFIVCVLVYSYIRCPAANITRSTWCVLGNKLCLFANGSWFSFKYGQVDFPGGVSNDLVNSVSSSLAGTVLTFSNDPGFGFEIHVLSSSSSSSVITELRVTAVRQLNGVTVECVGPSGSFTCLQFRLLQGECTIV